MSLKDYLRKAGNQALRLEKGLIEGDYFDYDDDATFLEKGLKTVGSLPFSILRPGQIISRLGEKQLGGRDFDFGGQEAFDLVMAIPAFKSLQLTNPKLALQLAKDFKKNFVEKGYKEAIDAFSKKSGLSTGFLKKGPLPKGTSEVKLKNRALKNTVKKLPDPNRTSLNQLRNLTGLGKGQTIGQRAVRSGLTGTALADKFSDFNDGESGEASEADASEASAEASTETKETPTGRQSGDITIRPRQVSMDQPGAGERQVSMDQPGAGEPQYNGLSPDASFNTVKTIGRLNPARKSSADRVTANIQTAAANEARAIQKRMYEQGRLDRLEADRNDARERNIAQRWNSSDTGRRSGLTWDELDDETKQGMRNRMYDFYKGSGTPQSMDEPEPQASGMGAPQASNRDKPSYVPRYGSQGFEGFNEGYSEGRFIPSGGQNQKTMLSNLMQQDQEDYINYNKSKNDNPFGREFRPAARKKRDEELYNPFA